MTAIPATGTQVRDRVSAARTRRWGAWYVAEHRLRGMKNYGWTIVVGAIGTPLIYLFAFGLGLARVVDAGADVQSTFGASFLLFVAPALLATTAMLIASEEFTFTIVSGFNWNPVFFGMNAAPIAPAQIVAGLLIAVGFRMIATLAVYFGIMLLFGAIGSGWAVLSILTATIAGTSVGMLLAGYSATLDPDRGHLTLVMRFVITPLFLFSGTFFPLTQLPIWLQWIGWISPLWHGSEAGRILSYGSIGDAGMLAVHILYPAALIVLGATLAVRVFTRRLNK